VRTHTGVRLFCPWGRREERVSQRVAERVDDESRRWTKARVRAGQVQRRPSVKLAGRLITMRTDHLATVTNFVLGTLPQWRDDRDKRGENDRRGQMARNPHGRWIPD
jgi:hypothetical protein